LIALKKGLRDLAASRGRVLVMVGAMTAAMIVFNAIIGAFAILTREMTESYMKTTPASATFEIPGGVGTELLAAVRQRPEVAAAVRRRSLTARYRSSDDEDFARARVFLIDDFESMPVARVTSESGAWPPPIGTVLLERSSLTLLPKKVGDHLVLRTPNGAARQVSISGIAHEPALAPAATEQAIYVYLTAETLHWLGEDLFFDELRVLMSSEANDALASAATSQRLAEWLGTRGDAVHSIRIPPPGKHPHHNQFNAVMVMFCIFGVMSLTLTGILIATLVDALMARQVREIAVMKATGATGGQVERLYISTLGSLAVFAFTLSLGPGVLGARAWTSAVARVLNFDVASNAIPLWAFAVQAGLSISIPLVFTMATVRRAAGVSVTRALGDHGASTAAVGQSLISALLARVRVGNRLVLFALRNSVRQQRRFLLTTGLLATAGGLFISALSLSKSWAVLTDRVFDANHYDVELVLQAERANEARIASLARQPDVEALEAWRFAPVAFPTAGGLAIQTTYPDENHGNFSLIAPPPGSTMVDRKLLAGRWLSPGQANEIVLNNAVPGFSTASVGKHIALSVAGRSHSYTIVGIVQEIAAAAAFVSPEAFAAAAGAAATTRVRVRLKGSSLTSERKDVGLLERRLLESGARLEDVVPLALLKNAVAGHFQVLVGALLVLAVLLAIVGVLGLSASMSASVVERTREFGVFRATGARPAQIRLVVWLEAMVVGAVSGLAALAAAVPLSLFIGTVIGRMSYGVALPLTLSFPAMGGWLLAAVALPTLAVAAPAFQAANLTVHEALAHV
jgi:putative ABC transport system permease protein